MTSKRRIIIIIKACVHMANSEANCKHFYFQLFHATLTQIVIGLGWEVQSVR